MSLGGRALHFVFKIGNREASINFYTKILGMTVLRHEEFEGGCEATCNGPYDGAWSKTMIGYGPEDNHFVLELTYNYGISSYKKGNDFLGLTIQSSGILERVKAAGYEFVDGPDKKVTLVSPCGYTFYIAESQEATPKITHCQLASSDIKASKSYWIDLLGLKNYESAGEGNVICGFADDQAKLQLTSSPVPIDRGSAFGRIAFSCPSDKLKGIQAKIEEAKQKVLTPYISLDTPGKATVQVVILADPDGHEICFVGDEGFRQLSQVDPKATELLEEAMKNDKSKEWFEKHGIDKQEV
jgi:lactoylglutathione lyase